MSTVLLACETIKNELELAMNKTGIDYPIIWVESGLHNYPDNLRERLQKELDRLNDYDYVLLAFGFCGNAVIGLRAGDFKLVVPKVDDCISLLIGSEDRRREISNCSATYFLTKGWLDNEKNIWVEYQHSVERFGRERTEKLFKTMLNHYYRLGVIDTGAYDFDRFVERTKEIADTLGLELFSIDGKLDYFKKLLIGPYDDRDFLVVHPGKEITYEHTRKGGQVL